MGDKITQDDIAEIAGVTQTTVGRWLKGTVPKGDDLVKIANHFGRSIDWLMGREVGHQSVAIRDAISPEPVLLEVLEELAELRERMKTIETKLRRLRK